MKEIYHSPECKVTLFAPVERLSADFELDFDSMLDAAGNVRPGENVSGGDISFDI